jgi:hypothetical protein
MALELSHMRGTIL